MNEAVRARARGAKRVVVLATPGGLKEYFGKAWPTVLANLQKRFATGPVDWTEWLQRMKTVTQ